MDIRAERKALAEKITYLTPVEIVLDHDDTKQLAKLINNLSREERVLFLKLYISQKDEIVEDLFKFEKLIKRWPYYSGILSEKVWGEFDCKLQDLLEGNDG